MSTWKRSSAPSVKQFPSKYIPSEMLADFRENPEPIARARMAEDEELPPPIPAEALEALSEATMERERLNTLSFADMRAQAGSRVSEMINQERERANIHARSSEAINRRMYGGRRRSRGGWSRGANVPRIIVARFPSRCAETGREIAAGEPILWTAGQREVYCALSNRYTEFQLQTENQA